MKLKSILTVLFGVSLVVANVTAAKITIVPMPVLGDVAVPAGFVAFGLAFLCSDLMVEYYGEEYATSVLWSSVVALLVAYAFIWWSIYVPPAPFYDSTAFDTVLGQSGAVIVASAVTIAVSQRFDVWLFARLRELTNGRRRWVRNCVSTATSQVVDTVLFISLSFAVLPWLQGGNPTTGATLASIIVGQYIAKLAVAAADTPLFYVITEVVSR